MLQQLAKVDALILDYWALTLLEYNTQHDLLEVIDDRTGAGSTVLRIQLPVETIGTVGPTTRRQPTPYRIDWCTVRTEW
ncbi:ATP-binding protein [Pseudomonas chlororaphis subsp. aurantiaca]|uniref:ATP-binding protein n=1 Tax=Pseudomonas chlororaphis TaxID=587753 RepID=UPI000F71105B|nr:ATP-binding protein [Pseudomonas chlororaphis]AZD56197.1 Mobile element protein [Pseudomonas chlororaphis subsp. aurantiaca]AZD62210.1 Mobile element protein [Pseudomonas chlororaphis subsp. aurantiaca]